MSESSGRRGWAVTGTVYGAFALVMGAGEALAVRGQMDFARHVLGLSGGWLAVAPVALEADALTWAALALWTTLTRDSGTLARAVTRAGTAAAVGAAAGANWLGAEAAGRPPAAAGANWLGAEAAGRPPAAAAYLAGASVMALAMWHTILHGVRRGELRAAGALEPPLPRFRLLRWLLCWPETWRAFRLAVREGLTSPADAIARARGELTPPAPAPDPAGVDYAALSKRAAVEHAAAKLGSYEPQRVCVWLAETHGVEVDHSYAAKKLRALAAIRRRELVQAVAVEG